MKQVLKYLEKYRSQVIFAAVCVSSVFILFWVIIPQINIIGETQQDLSDVQKKLEVTKKSVEALSVDNTKILDEDLQTVSEALPPDKDITNIYTALVQTATLSNVSFQGFTVQIGDIYSKKQLSQPADSKTGSPSVKVSAKFGNINKETFSELSKNLSKSLPLSEIEGISVVGGEGEVEINFFYKPYNLAAIGRQDVVPILSQDQQALIDNLTKDKP